MFSKSLDNLLCLNVSERGSSDLSSILTPVPGLSRSGSVASDTADVPRGMLLLVKGTVQPTGVVMST